MLNTIFLPIVLSLTSGSPPTLNNPPSHALSIGISHRLFKSDEPRIVVDQLDKDLFTTPLFEEALILSNNSNFFSTKPTAPYITDIGSILTRNDTRLLVKTDAH